MSENGGKLAVVPTPIGNLGDVTSRALDALRASDIIYAEDTRVTSKFLNAVSIDPKRLARLDENVMDERAGRVCDQIEDGMTVAFCSDAGMPAVSDPGARLIAAAYARGLKVEVLPGPSAAVCAYVASGTLYPSYYFGGFFPRQDSERKELLDSLRSLDAALVFYESPHRVADSLKVMAEAYPDRGAAVCRELTKIHEEVCRLPLPDLAREFADREADGTIKGEIVIVVDGVSAPEKAEVQDEATVRATSLAGSLAKEGLSRKSIVKVLASQFDITRNAAYKIALDVKTDGDATDVNPLDGIQENA